MTPEVMSIVFPAAVAALSGFVFGLAYFAAMRATVARIVAGSGWMVPTTLTAARIIAVTILLFFMARLGAAPLLATFVGLLIARQFALQQRRGR
ncbi:hypothetical protein LG047_19375 [Methylocystis sp. WRRC1]|jgi:hypothetical protein|uniref:N-ATPase subunit AtpR n=1 Tax=Methylocystis sp. WRRC1 TaxID=1732014 RepID=UPI001D13F222|nr:ATP synthase subunit I [Methylocystis sp. WRRC1]MCC3247453.1 hypothetical protein [Methylocystis sp. WRRC1]